MVRFSSLIVKSPPSLANSQCVFFRESLEGKLAAHQEALWDGEERQLTTVFVSIDDHPRVDRPWKLHTNLTKPGMFSWKKTYSIYFRMIAMDQCVWVQFGRGIGWTSIYLLFESGILDNEASHILRSRNMIRHTTIRRWVLSRYNGDASAGEIRWLWPKKIGMDIHERVNISRRCSKRSQQIDVMSISPMNLIKVYTCYIYIV